MDWKRSLPTDLFYISKNGLVIPRYISKPLFSFTLFTFIFLTFAVLTIVIPLGHGDSIICIPESAHSKFQYLRDGTAIDSLVIVYMSSNSKIWISCERIDNPDLFTLADELFRQFLKKKDWIKKLKVSFLTKKYFQYAGYIGNNKKLFLRIDCSTPWGKVAALLRAAQAAGVSDACLLTEEACEPKQNGDL